MKSARPFPAPELRAEILWTSRFLWFISVSRRRGRDKGRRKQMRASANKRRQTLTNASIRRGENASKRDQTWTNANNRLDLPFLRFLHPPSAIPLLFRAPINRSDFSAIFWRFSGDSSAISAVKLAIWHFSIWKRSDFSAIAILWDAKSKRATAVNFSATWQMGKNHKWCCLEVFRESHIDPRPRYLRK